MSSNGDDNNNKLSGDYGNDTIIGLGGDDTLLGNHGNDSLDGGSGNDEIRGDSLIVDLNALAVPNSVAIRFTITNNSPAPLELRAVYENGSADYVTRTIAPDTSVSILGRDGRNYLLTEVGTQNVISVVSGINGAVYEIDSGDYADSISGGSGADKLYGDLGDDTIRGDAGNDTLFGGSGNDDLQGGDDADSIVGGSGDVVDGGEGASAGHTDMDTLTVDAVKRVDFDADNRKNGTVVFRLRPH